MSSDRNRPYRGLFGMPPPTSTDNFFNDLLKSLEASAPTPARSDLGLGALFSPQSSTPQPNVLGSLFGLASPRLPPLNTYNVLGATPAPASQTIPSLPYTPPIRRKVFFSFHYSEDVMRAGVVRNSWRFRRKGRLATSNFIDKSLWESSPRQDETLKRLIRDGMRGSTATCVLAGTWTWLRPWVRFEIAHSLFIKNGLFVAFVHNLRDPDFGPAELGYNPLAFVGLQLRADGRGNVCELIEGAWWPFEAMKRPVPWPKWMPKPQIGYVHPLSIAAPAYDYVRDNGYDNLCHWAQDSVRATGRNW